MSLKYNLCKLEGIIFPQPFSNLMPLPVFCILVKAFKIYKISQLGNMTYMSSSICHFLCILYQIENTCFF